MARDPEEIFETWVFNFSPKSSIFSLISIEVTFWLFNIKHSHNLTELKSVENSSSNSSPGKVTQPSAPVGLSLPTVKVMCTKN
jgi:hypothetical protein